ncbi:MAG TPA: CRISPR-associated helicase Cas3' [Cyanobacteria bacterium UBA11372]|nr:CRISPR-associated helicase Cas3' [Cyanobacteria bacterium UBA11372]
MKRLLAKSYDRKIHNQPPDYALLIQHSRDVAAACKALAKVTGSVALFNAGLEAEILHRFGKTLLLNGWSQDLGKGNSHFQSMVTNQTGFIQLLRHEVISGLLLFLNEPLQDWQEPLKDIKLIALWGAMGHHRKFDYQTHPNAMVPPLTVHLAHPDFNAILTEMGQDLELGDPPKFEQDWKIEHNLAQDLLDELFENFEKSEANFNNEKERRLLALIKAYGIAADVAASAVARKGESAKNYSLAQFVTNDLSIGFAPEELKTIVHTWAWKSTKRHPQEWDISKLPPSFIIREFQNQVAASESYITLAVAGCGSGKSLAAYLWAQNWCDKLSGNTNFRLFFCLPTTGTTTEHFKDYALESGIPAELISLTHSRSSVDLETMAATADQEEATEGANTTEAAREALKAEQDKIDALALWSTALVVTTTDTVLGLMANARRSIYSIPAIMQSAIVFDEIHAFDDLLFGHLLVFIKNFPKLPVLLMTASLPEARLRAIQKVRPDMHLVPGDEKLEQLPRYYLQYPVNNEDIWDEVTKCIAKNGKVLWVRNRVDWANEIYDEVRDRFRNISVNVYHARFRYKDRSIRHRRVIDEFKNEGKPVILVANQVAEMSLDLSADLLITDIAPIPGLIQRLGRLNRRATPEKPGEPKKALICPQPKVKGDAAKPYKKDELETAEGWINRLIALNKPLHQKDLADEFSALSDDREFDYAKAEKEACFFSGLWKTRVGMTRSEGYTISVILEKDYEQCDDKQYGEPTAKWLRKHEFTIPFKSEALKWKQVSGIRIAPDEAVLYDYDEITHEGKGAAWR